ncbi:hypothetical protein [Succinatimonas hippei]|uniref:hypothetical protein n=1 Tax=Succinatimonas hippei TaxID=626938 RepID=UPI002492C96A|nr:hypothetical protein [Succinatimonas hippei]
MKYLIGGLIVGFTVGFTLAYYRGKNELLSYQLEAQSQYSSILEQKDLTEKIWASTAQEISEQSHNEVNAINQRYNALLTDNKLLKQSAAKQSCLSTTAATSAGTQSGKTDRQPDSSGKLCEKSLVKAKKQILYYGKELDICAVHYNTILKIYKSAQEL